MRVFLMIEGQLGVTWPQWVTLADACEEAGLDGLFRSDHYFSEAAPRGGSLDAWATLAALAARTRRIRLGTLVSPVAFRHPSELARVVVTADHVSGGRVELGLGAGWNEREHTGHGFLFPPIGERMDMLAEQLEIVTRSWTEEAFTFEGSHYRIVDCPAQPKPLQQPRPPVIMGGQAGPRACALAARFADEYNTFAETVEECRVRRARVMEACEREGRDPASMRFSLMTPCAVGSSRSEVVERVGAALRAVGDAREPQEVLDGSGDAWITGTPAQVVARLAELEEAGVDRVYLQHLAHEDLEMVALVGEEVAPVVSG